MQRTTIVVTAIRNNSNYNRPFKYICKWSIRVEIKKKKIRNITNANYINYSKTKKIIKWHKHNNIIIREVDSNIS